MSAQVQIPKPFKLARRTFDKHDGQQSLQSQMQMKDDECKFFCRSIQAAVKKHLDIDKVYQRQDLASQKRFHEECRSIPALERYVDRWPARAIAVQYLTQIISKRNRIQRASQRAPATPLVLNQSLTELLSQPLAVTHNLSNHSQRSPTSPTTAVSQPIDRTRRLARRTREASNPIVTGASSDRVLRSATIRIAERNNSVANPSPSRAPVVNEEPLPESPSRGNPTVEENPDGAVLEFLKSLRPPQIFLLPTLSKAGLNDKDSLLIMMFNASMRESFFTILARQHKITLLQATLLKEGLVAMR